MKYTIKAHPTKYAGVQFRSRLEARWACFFDLVKWQWQYEPIDLEGWSPDFRVEFPCGHSECNGSHVLLVEVKPYFNIRDFDGHPCKDYPFGQKFGVGDDVIGSIPADASAAFGANPSVTGWEMAHGAGGGWHEVAYELGLENAMEYWKDAGNMTQWIPR
jgi:hypothetical protein